MIYPTSDTNEMVQQAAYSLATSRRTSAIYFNTHTNSLTDGKSPPVKLMVSHFYHLCYLKTI